MNSYLQELNKRVYWALRKAIKGNVETWYDDQGSICIKVVQTFSYFEKIEDAVDFFQTCTVDEFTKMFVRKYKAFIVDKYIFREAIV